jgi:hypothetical protein
MDIVSDVVMGVGTGVVVDVSLVDGVVAPVGKPPRKLPAATEMPRSNRCRCIMPGTEAFSKRGAIFCLMP